jgi:hypothetical protein
LKKTNLNNSKGFSVIFLIIALLLMVIIGYVFSYLIPSKHKSIVFSIQSTQAFFLAQSGVEFAVRYAVDQGWTTPAQLNSLDAMTRNLGKGRFVLDYDSVNNILYSWGEVPSGKERKRIRVSNFTQFLATRSLILWTPDPCVERGHSNSRVDFYIRNDGTLPVTLGSFSGQWTHSPTRDLNRIYFDGTEKYRNNGGYSSGDGQTNFNRNPNPPRVSTFTFNPGDTFMVQLRFSGDIRGARNVIFTFYDTDGNPYQFNLGTLQQCP